MPVGLPTRSNSSETHSGFTAAPSSSETTYPLARHASPAANFSAAWRLCSAVSAATRSAGSGRARCRVGAGRSEVPPQRAGEQGHPGHSQALAGVAAGVYRGVRRRAAPGHRVTVEILPDDRTHVRLPVNDAEIIARAVYLRSLFPTSARVILVSGDMSMEFCAAGPLPSGVHIDALGLARSPDGQVDGDGMIRAGAFRCARKRASEGTETHTIAVTALRQMNL
jgi:hypothetical protein